MLELFRKEQPVSYIFLLLYCLLLRLASFFGETNWKPLTKDPLSELIYQSIGYNNFTTTVVGTLLIFFQAIMINSMVNRNRITRENSMFPGLFYILTVCLFPDFNYLSPALLANTFIILMLYNIFDAYKINGANPYVFNAGIFAGCAMLMDFSYLIFFFGGLVGFSIVKAFKFNERIQYFIGMLIPVFLTGTYYFLFGHLTEFIQMFQDNLAWLDWKIPGNYVTYMKIGLFVFIALFTLLNFNNYGKKSNVHAQRKVEVLFWFIALGALTFLFQPGVRLDHLLVIAVPVGTLLGFSILVIENKQIAEVVHLLLISLSFVFQYIF